MIRARCRKPSIGQTRLSDLAAGHPVAMQGLREYQSRLTDEAVLALIEFARNQFADQCQGVAVHHFANKLAWSQENVDPLEIEAERGADEGATECCNAIQKADCHRIFMAWKASKLPSASCPKINTGSRQARCSEF